MVLSLNTRSPMIKLIIIFLTLFISPVSLSQDEMTDLFVLAVYDNDVTLVKELIQQDANVNSVNARGFAPLHIATVNNNIEIVELLLKNDAKVNIKNHDKNTPLHLSALTNHTEIAELLLKNDAKTESYNNAVYVHGENTAQLTPLHLAALNDNLEVAQVLLDYGADPNADVDVNINTDDMSPFFMLVLPLVMTITNEHAYDDYTPLHFASEKGSLKMMKLLLEHEADINARDDVYFTPLQLAAREGHLEAVKFLLEKGADPNLGSLFSSPLKIAQVNNYKEVVKLLKSYGAE